MSTLKRKILLYLTIASAPLYLVKFSILNLPTNLLEILIFINLFFWLLALTKDSQKKITAPSWQISLSVGLILTGTIVSIFTNDAMIVGIGILKSWFLIPLIFAFITYQLLDDDADIETALSAAYFSAVLIGGIALVYKFLAILTFDGRLAAFYASPNYLALYLVPSVAIGYYLLAKAFEKKSQLLKKLLLGFSLTIVLLAVFYTYSYTGWVTVFLLTIITTFFYLSKKIALFSFFVILTLFLMIIFSQAYSQKFSALITLDERSSLSSRIMIWKASEKMLFDHPIIGIGPGNFQAKYLSLQPQFPPYLEWAVPQPHNIFLAFWLQTSILGFIGFISLLFFVFNSLIKKLNTLNKVSIEIVLFSFFLYIVIYGLVDTPFWKNDLAFLFWIHVSLFSILLKKYFYPKSTKIKE